MARPSMRPRGESDLGRPANGSHKHTNPSLRSRSDVQVESAKASTPRRLLSGLLFPLPWMLAAWGYRAHVRHETSPSPLGSRADVASSSLLDACLYTSALTSALLLTVTGMNRVEALRNHKEKNGTPADKNRSQNDATWIRQVIIRLAALWLPFFAAIQLGPLSAALPLTLAVLSGFGARSAKSSSLIRDARVHRFKLGAAVAIATISLLFRHSGHLTASLLGWTALVTSISFLPSQLIFITRPASSAWQAQFQSSQPSPLVATTKDSTYSAYAAYLSLTITAAIYFLSPTHFVLHIASAYLFMLALASAVFVVYLVRSTHFMQNHAPFAASCAMACFISLMVDLSVPSFLLSVGASALSTAAVFLDQSSSPKLANKHHDHSHHAHHDHNHSHHHHHSQSGHSRMTGYLLSLTPAGSILHSILSERDSRRIAYFGCLNLAFMLVQFFYGFATGSLGLLTDSIHMLFDCLGLAVGLAAAVVSKWPPSLNFPYGYAKIDTLSGFANGIFLILVSVEIIFDAIHRLRDGHELRRLNELLIVSILGFLVNIVGLTAFGHAHHHGHGHAHDHSHAHSHSREHSHSDSNAHKTVDNHSEPSNEHNHHEHKHSDTPTSPVHAHEHNENMQGIFLHILADALGSVAVIISTLLTKHSSWNGWDPLASCLIAILIFFSAIPLVKSSGSRLLLSLSDEAEYKCRGTLQGLSDLPHVIGYSGVRLWLKDQESDQGHADHNHHGHNHTHAHDHEEHRKCDADKPQISILGVIHIVASRPSDMNVVRRVTGEYLNSKGMDVVVHVEYEGDRCWCGAGQYSPRKISK